MARRLSGRPPRSKNARIIASSAVLRSLESATPSRLTTLRLLGDASRADATSSAPARSGTGGVEPGARALVNSALAVLLTMPSLGGTLHRRALSVLRAGAPLAGASAMLAASERATAHMHSLRPGGIADGNVEGEAAFIAAADAVASCSRCEYAGRAAADEAVRALLAIKGTPTVRAAAARAAGVLLESYPANFAADVRLIDAACDAVFNACNASSAGSVIGRGKGAKPGFAMLASAVVARLTARQQMCERLLRCCAGALGDTLGEEKSAWAVAVVRIAIVLRASRAKRPVRENFEKRSARKPATAAVAGTPVSNQHLFETALVTVARVSGLSCARGGSTLALATLLSAWTRTELRAVIPARCVVLLATEMGSVAAACMLRDAMCISVVPRYEAPGAYGVLDQLAKISGMHGRVADALVVDLCSVFVRRFGRCAVLETKIASGMDVDEPLLDRLIARARSALASNFAAGRLAGVRLMTALASAVPDERVQLLTSLLQGLRFGDLKLDGTDGVGMEDLVSPIARGTARPNAVATGLSAVLGNAVALAALVEELAGEEKMMIPRIVLKQVAVSAMNLMRPLAPASPTDHYRQRVATAIRRRAGWAIFAALGRVGAIEKCIEGGMPKLFDHWRADLTQQETADIVLELEEILAGTAMRSAALAALATCLEFENSLELRKYAPFLIGASAARVALARNATLDGSAPPVIYAGASTVMEDPLFYRASLNSNTSLTDSLQPDNDNAKLSGELLIVAESLQIARCATFAPPVGTAGELCYYITLSLGEDAQKALGDAAGAPVATGVVAQFLNSFNKPSVDNTAIANRRLSLCTLRGRNGSGLGTDLAWMCSTEGVEMPLAEETVVTTANAISALVVEGISLPGSVCEQFCSSGAFSPVFSSVVALAVTKRISAVDLSANGRVLAMLQLLVARGLKATVMPHRADSIPRNLAEGPWNGTCINDSDLPGAVFRALCEEDDDRLPPLFPLENPLRAVAYNSAHTRCVGMVSAASVLTCSAFRELARKGGAAMWQGLMKSATSSLLQSLEAGNVNLAATSAAVLGTLTDGAIGTTDRTAVRYAVFALAQALESDFSHVQMCAALALNGTLKETAMFSERILAALTRAWSLDDGVDMSLGQLYKCASNIHIWESSVARLCNRVLPEYTGPFLSEPVSAPISPALAIGASAVLSACGKHKMVNATAVAAAELCAELLHDDSHVARAAGLRGLQCMWTARILSGNTSGTVPRSPDSGLVGHGTKYVPIQFFSIRQPVQVGSSAGLFLEDVVYDALQSGKQGVAAGLQAAALDVVYLLLREAGRKAVCANFQKLPEILFMAAQDGLDCRHVLEILADADGTRRPKYWIGLCRAVALGGKRLGAANKNETWDVNVKTRRLALRVMRITITSSLAKCNCRSKDTTGDDESTEATDIVHSCVLGCLKETLGAMHAAMRITPLDAASVEEVCSALSMLASHFQRPSRIADDMPRTSFEAQWGSVSDILANLLNTKSAYRVVQTVAQTATHWLLAACFLDVQTEPLCRALFGKELAGVTRRFEYLEKSELCGTQTVVCVLASIARLVATRALHAALYGAHEIDGAIRAYLPVLRNLLFATIVDCCTLRSPAFREDIASTGGAVVFAGPSGEDVQRIVLKYWPWLIVGANVVADQDGRNCIETISWINDGSPGVEMLRLGDDTDGTLEMIELCFALWLTVVEDGDAVRRLFDPREEFLDIANFCVRVTVQCMEKSEQMLAYNVLSMYGRSVDEIKAAASDPADSDAVIALGDNLSHVALGTEIVVPEAVVDAEAGEAVLDREDDDESSVETVPVASDEADHMRFREAASTDGRLLRSPIPQSDLDRPSLPPATIAFDELDRGKAGKEPALPYASLEDGAFTKGINISEPIEETESEAREEEAEAREDESDTREEKTKVVNEDEATESEERVDEAFSVSAVTDTVGNGDATKTASSEKVQTEEKGKAEEVGSNGMTSSDSLSDVLADGDIAKFAQSIAQSVMHDVAQDELANSGKDAIQETTSASQ